MVKKQEFKCPYKGCNKKYKTSRGFILHLNLKHNIKYGINVSTIFTVLLAVVLSPLYAPNVIYFYDKYVLHEEPDFYLSVNSVYLFDNDKFVNLANQTNKIYFLNKQVEIGLIPPWHNDIEPNKFNLTDPKTNKTSCLFFSYSNVNRFLFGEEVPLFLRLQNFSKAVYFMSKAPSREILDVLSSDCESCLGQLFYGNNKGERNIDKLNLEICYNEKYFIEYTDFEQIGDHCFRIKRENLIHDEDVLGFVLVKDYNTSIYYDLWSHPSVGLFSKVYGEYESEGIRFQLNETDIAQTISGVFPLCQVS